MTKERAGRHPGWRLVTGSTRFGLTITRHPPPSAKKRSPRPPEGRSRVTRPDVPRVCFPRRRSGLCYPTATKFKRHHYPFWVWRAPSGRALLAGAPRAEKTCRPLGDDSRIWRLAPHGEAQQPRSPLSPALSVLFRTPPLSAPDWRSGGFSPAFPRDDRREPRNSPAAYLRLRRSAASGRRGPCQRTGWHSPWTERVAGLRKRRPAWRPRPSH
jgi:hypothetical protein